MRKILLAAALGAAVAASPAMATSGVSSTVKATFVNAQPVDTTYTGLNSDHVTWGEPASNGGSVNKMAFTANSRITSTFNTKFKVGTLSYYNGTTWTESLPTSIGLKLAFNFTDPKLGSFAKTFALGLATTPNTGSPDANADYVYLPAMTSSDSFKVNGQAYTFQLLGFSNIVGDGFLNSTSRELHVREGGTATADLFGVVTAVPEPATWAMMLVGFGMAGTAMRYRRREAKATFA